MIKHNGRVYLVKQDDNKRLAALRANLDQLNQQAEAAIAMGACPDAIDRLVIINHQLLLTRLEMQRIALTTAVTPLND